MQHASLGNQEQQQHGKGVTHTTRLTLLANIGLSAGKMLLGLIGQSQTLVADAVHSLSDCITDAGILVGVRYWSAPADERHPYGHWRLEALVTIAMGLCLTAVAGGLVFRAIQAVRTGTGTAPAWYTLAAAIVTIISKEAMFQWTVRKAHQYRSRALTANAWHQRSDALSSIPAAIAIASAMIFPELRFIDPIGAVAVSAFILLAAIRIFRDAAAELMDESLPPATLQQIETAVCQIPGVNSVHALRSRRSGPGFFLDLHVLVPASLTVRQSHDIAETVRQNLLRGTFNILDAVVHIEPNETG